jgi:divalent metal cation (Fe/Co/Zn/Cd) transporter
MKLKDQVMFANLAIFGGMVVAYFQGFPILYIVGCGVLAFVVVSAFFFYRIRSARRQRESGQ